MAKTKKKKVSDPVVSKNAVSREIKTMLGSYLQIKPSSIRGGHELKKGLKMIGQEVALLYKPCTRIAMKLGKEAGTKPLRIKRKESRKFKKVSDVLTLTHKRSNGK